MSLPLNRAVIIAVPAVSMVEVAVHYVISVIAVRNCIVPTRGAVDVDSFVLLAFVSARASACMLQAVLVYVVAVMMMKMSIMKIVDVIGMLDGSVSAFRIMRMLVVGMLFASHLFAPLIVRSELLIETAFVIDQICFTSVIHGLSRCDLSL